ncbi:RNA polymerase, sigma subunit, ECF family [Lentzea xinjiangensis]|uniref:RNA polymerase, sigma subunit, ECF family n=1 Tax=Lentzea xinjiangensis TaxID=402600 RepID=A0A1H9P9F6_9PSEU|nr:sigma-70 family RNA polymerase sigma factor [Lentzea xinjiangensis]SER44822.1 RNA polymerase, sigma subunit, ECF family [Lentzea xinjiangensis]
MTTEDPDDRALWSQAAGGSAHAFGVLFDRHAKAVYNHCFRLTASWAEAEDHLQATFLLAWRKRGQVAKLERESALPWLLTVATNVVRNEQRSFTRRLKNLRRLNEDTAVPDHADMVVARLDDQRRMQELLKAVATLPRNEQEALALCVWSGVSYEDAAAVLGIAAVSVRARVSKAKAKLQQFRELVHTGEDR